MSDSSEAEAPQQRPDSLIDKDQGRKYWDGVDADDNGMLGGFPQVSRSDLQGSRSFLARMGIGARHGRRRLTRALEGGAGIGRITRGLLLPISDTVDVIEPMAKFTAALRDVPGVGRISNVGLEEWRPEEEERGVQYDLIWNQWCVGHLTDDQLEEYLRVCATVLEPERGLIVVKENLASIGADKYDEIDSSVTRQDSSFIAIFKRAGLRIVRMEMQRELRVDEDDVSLLPVKMYAMRPQAV